MAETFYAHLEFAGKHGWSVNLPFLCTRCGKCCTIENFLTAGPLSGAPEQNPDAHAKSNRLYQKMGDLWAQNETEYDRYIAGSSCPFLTEEDCSIYEIRPEGCRRFPKTAFGMLTTDCEALIRFKRQRATLKKGRSTTETSHHTVEKGEVGEGPIKSVEFTEKQYQTCVQKLNKIGITNDELTLFKCFNQLKRQTT